jgi:hypothetical protein
MKSRMDIACHHRLYDKHASIQNILLFAGLCECAPTIAYWYLEGLLACVVHAIDGVLASAPREQTNVRPNSCMSLHIFLTSSVKAFNWHRAVANIG